MNLVAFEVMNNVRITVRLTVVDFHGRADIRLGLEAHRREEDSRAVPPLASVSLSCSGLRLKKLEAALIRGLYMLDSQLVSSDVDEGPKK
jgi:hypothetical protein